MESSVRGSFESGNYAEVARSGAAGDWRTHAARALIGAGDGAALDALRAAPDPEARFYLAAGLWIRGDEDAAAGVLERETGAAARRLLALIRKPRIEVLAQLPWKRTGAWDLLGGAAVDAKFRVRNASTAPGDLPVGPYADVHALCDPHSPPDFYLCQMIEWHLLPGNLSELRCPLFAQSGDYDLHIQAIHPWLRAFDEILVTDPSEWRDLTRLTPLPVTTFPKSFGVDAAALPEPPRAPRSLDVIQSGTLLQPFHPDKADLLHEVLALEGIRVVLLDGFIRTDEYMRLLGDCKLTYTHIRHPGATPTRALDALAMGCCALVQEASVLRLYAGEEHGVIGYGAAPGALAVAIRRVLGDWPRFELAARAGAAQLRREFALATAASQLLRFLTVRAALCERARRAPAPACQKRVIVWRGWVPSGAPPALLEEQTRQTVLRMAREPASARREIDLTRELLLQHANRLSDSGGFAHDEAQLAEVLGRLRRAAASYPDSLVLQFNAVRACLHYGGPADVAWALERGESALARGEHGWQSDPLDDVLPWDFAGALFNYRAYFDRANQALHSGVSACAELPRLLLAGLAHYLGAYGDRIPLLVQAQQLDPEFPMYRLSLALAWLRRGGAEGRAHALPILAGLTQRGVLLFEARALLQELRSRGVAPLPALDALEHELQRVVLHRPEGGLLDTDARIAPSRRDPLLACAPLPTPVTSAPCTVSALLLVEAGQEHDLDAALRALHAQSLGAALEVIAVHARQGEPLWGAAARAARGARGEFLIALHPLDRMRSDALERMVVALRAHPERAAAYPDAWVSSEPFASFEEAAHAGELLRRPSFDPFAESHSRRCGPIALWRRRAYEAAGGFDETLDWYGDWELCLRAVARERLLQLREPLFALRDEGARRWHCERGRLDADWEVLRRTAQGLVRAARSERLQRLIPQPAASGVLILVQCDGASAQQIEEWLARAGTALAGCGSVALRSVRERAQDCGVDLVPAVQSVAGALAGRGGCEYELLALWPAELAPELCAEALLELRGERELGAVYGGAASGGTPRFAILRSAALIACGGIDVAPGSQAPRWEELFERMRRRGLGARSAACAAGVEAAAPAADLRAGERAFAEGRLAEAREIFGAMVQADPAHADARSNLGCTLWSQGEARAAIDELRAALRCDPRHRGAVLNLGACLLATGSAAEAQLVYRAYLQDAPGDAEVQQALLLAQARLAEASGEGSAAAQV